MDLKEIGLPIGVLVVALVILGIVTVSLTWSVNDKVSQLSDLNTSIDNLTIQVNALNADNLGVKTNYNTLLTTYNTTNAALTASQAQVSSLTSQVTTMNNEINNLNANNASLRADYNAYVANTAQLRIDYNALSTDRNLLFIDNNKLRFDNNFMVIDRNNLLTSRNDLNVRAHRLYNYANPCYLAVKCIDNNSFCAAKYGYDLNNIVGVAQYNLQILTLKTSCITGIDSNIGDYNYFS